MATKGPKKKESKDLTSTSQQKDNGGNIPVIISDDRSSTKRKAAFPLWPEWNEQEITNEKWDSGKKEKERGRSPNSVTHTFDDPEGKIELPFSLRSRVKIWKRPSELCEDKNPVIVDFEQTNEPSIDLLSPNEHIIDSELIRSILAVVTALLTTFSTNKEPECISSINKMKITQSKEYRESKADKSKKDVEINEEKCWKPWDLIWPKENAKGNISPSFSPFGKYAVKIYWMGCFRKIIVDDAIPCDENMKPLLPFTTRRNEFWPAILAKALIKVASLDYLGGEDNSEMGDVDFVTCLTGWLPEKIPIEKGFEEKLWPLLLRVLPNWKLPQPPAPTIECNKDNMESLSDGTFSKAELSTKDSKDFKAKKDTKDEKKNKVNDKFELKGGKEKNTSCSNVKKVCTPDVIVFASFTNPPHKASLKISEFKTMSDESEKLRQFGLSHNLPYPVHVSVARNCSLIPPPVPILVPRWKLIRQKKKKEIIEPPYYEPSSKDPKFLELKPLLFNHNVGMSLSTTNCSSPSKYKKFKRMEILNEEGKTQLEQSENEALLPTMTLLSESQSVITNNAAEPKVLFDNKTRRLSNSSLVSVNSSPSKVLKKVKIGNESKRVLMLKELKSPRHNSKADIITTDSPTRGVELNTDLVGDSDGEITMNIEKEINEKIVEKNDLWIEFNDFCQCFRALWIYHKPKTFTRDLGELKSSEFKNDKPKKSQNTIRNSATSPTSVSLACGTLTGLDSSFSCLLVDCMQATEVIISFTAITRWFDSNSPKDENDIPLPPSTKPMSGSLVIEPYSWKRIIVHPSVLSIVTTATKASALAVPPGRHVFRLVANAPLGYHITISSCQDFMFGDEDSILQCLTKECTEFISHAVSVVKQVGRIIKTFEFPLEKKTDDTSKARKDYLVMGTESASNAIRRDHFSAYFESFKATIKSEFPDTYTKSINFAIDALKYESYFHLTKFSSESVRTRPTSTETPARHYSTGAVQPKSQSMPTIATIQQRNLKEDVAATRIQALYRGYNIMRLKRAHKPGTSENIMISELLQKIWSHIENNMNTISTQIYHHMLGARPHLIRYFSFYSDEWNKIIYIDYNGTYVDQPIDTFYVIFREIFFVPEEALVMPKFYSSISSCNVRVIDNDTCRDIKTVFMKVVPQIWKPNKTGYTIVALGHSESNLINGGKLRLRLIGEKEPLPYPIRENPNSLFLTKEIKEYYMPNRYKRIFRHTITVTEDLLASIEMSTSNIHVHFKLQILDHDKELYSCEGKACVVIPAILFYKDRMFSSEDKKSSTPNSRDGSGRTSIKVSKQPLSSKKSVSPDKVKRKSVFSFGTKNEDEEVEEEVTHKYVIQAYVLRDSWPLTKKQWYFIENFENVGGGETIPEPVKKNSAGKSRKSKQSNQGSRSRPDSQTHSYFDVSQAYFNLRFVVDSNMEHAVAIKRDTEREDQVNAIKSAWEAMQPGRAAKAQLSRLKYLESHTIKQIRKKNTDDSEAKNNDAMNGTQPQSAVSTLFSAISPEPETEELYHNPPPKETLNILRTFDTTPYIRSSGKKIVLDEHEEELLRSLIQEKFTEFQSMRDAVLAMRESNRVSRNAKKEKQLAQYEFMQVQLDEAREKLYKQRDFYRSKFIKQPEQESVETDLKRKRTPSPRRNTSKTAKPSSRMKKK